MYSLGVILFEMWTPPFSTLMERATTIMDLRRDPVAATSGDFEKRVPTGAVKIIR